MITQRLRPRLALTLLCTLLLVNDGFSGSARAQARALEEDPLLPPVVPIESATSKSGSSGERDPLVPAAAAATTVASYPAGDKPLEAAVSNSNNNSLSPQTNAVEASKSPPDAASQSSEDSNITRKQEDTSKTGESASKPADVPQAAPPAEGLVPSEPAKAAAAEVPAPATTAQEKDLKSLLENKNDAENDLASSPTGATGSAPDSAANANRKSPVDDVPVSVVAESDKPNSNNDRFHYSLGAVDSADKQQPAGEKAPDSPAAASPKDKDKEEGSDKEEDTREPEAQDEPDEETDKRKETPEKKDAAADEEQAAAATTTTNTTPKPEQPAESSTSVTKESPVSPAAAPKQSVAEDKGASAEPVTTAASSSPVGGEASSSEASKPAKEEASAGAEAAAADKPLAKPADAGAADDTKIVTDQPSKSPDSATAAVATAEQPGSRSDASTTTTTTTTTTPGPSTSASSAVVAKSDEPKPPIEEAPQQKPAASAKPEPVEAASAAAAAAGAVAGSALANGLSGKDKPVVASPAAAAPAPASKAVTTAAPSSEEPSSPSSPSTTRKSSTNRWNTWSTSTTSSTPPPSTRRRPILPSIRRRFRPYNVFPWAMPESYSPLEPVAPADTEPMFGRPNIDSVPSSVSSPKPKRRGGSTSTTTTVEPSPSSSASTSRPTSSSTTTSKPERDDESDADTPTYSSRRKVPSESSGSGVGGSTKRRHHHHHHHRHHNTHKGGHHYHSTTNRFSPENAGGELPSWGSGSDSFESQMPPKRRFDSHAGERPHRPSSSHHHGGSRPWHSSHGARRTNKHNDDPFTSFSPSGPTGPLDPSFSPNRPQSGFGLFNSPSGGSPSSTAGSGFDLLNPFSWIDEVTKPRPRPSLSSSPVGGGRDHHSSFRPSHMGPAGAARPLSGQRPHAYEGEFSESAGGSGGLGPSHHHGDIDRPLSAHDETYNHHHDHHNTHRPHGGSGLGRPLVGGGSIGHGRDDYDDYHDCHGHDHDRDRDRDHDHDHHGRPYPRPPYRPTRPGRDDYDDAGPVYGSRPGGRPIGDRPYSRRDENASEGAGGATGPALESETPVLRNRESTRSASTGERLESGSSSASGGSDSSSASGPAAGPRRVPSSVFSPFDTLFGSLDDDLFGGLRSSFIDTPLKAAAETIRQTNNAAFDAIISSPKISLPPSGGDQSSSAAAAGQAGGNLHKQHQTVSEPHSARVIMARVESNEPAIQSTGKPTQVVSSSDTARKSAIKEFFEQIENLRKRREQLLLTSNSGGGNNNSNNSNNNNHDKNTGNNSNLTTGVSSSTPPPQSADLADSTAMQHDRGTKPQAAELPPPMTTFRGGIKHFLMLI